MTQRDELITVTLTRTNFYTRMQCLFCGGSSNKDAVNAEVLSAVVNVPAGQVGPGRTGLIVCAACLQREADQLSAVIRDNAEWHHERAAELEAIAANLPALPSYSEWKKANDEFNEEKLRHYRSASKQQYPFDEDQHPF